jgi:multiple sugar transport system substrate-binding protein
MKRAKKILCFLLAAIMLLALAACGSTTATETSTGTSTQTSSDTSNSTSKPYEGVTLRFVADNHSWTTAMEDTIAEFEEETGAKVEVEAYSEDNLLSKLNVEFAAGSQSMDVVMFRPPLDAGTFIGNGWLENLDSYISADTEFDYDDISAGASEPCIKDGSVYGIPVVTEVEILYYRKDILEANNIEVPTTFDELLAACEQLTDKENELYGFVARGALSPSVTQCAGFVFSNGADWVSSDLKTCQIDDDGVVEAISLYGNLLGNYGPPGILDMSWSEAMTLFAQGKAVFATEASATASVVTDPTSSVVSDKVGFAMFPSATEGEDPVPYNIAAWALGINSNSKNKDAAWALVSKLAGKEAQEYAQNNGVSSARISSWANAQATDLMPQELLDLVSECNAKGIGRGYNFVAFGQSVQEARNLTGSVVTTSIETGGDKDAVLAAAQAVKADFQAILDSQ